MKTRRKKFFAARDFSIDGHTYSAGDPYPDGDRHLDRLIRFGHVADAKSQPPNTTTEEANDATE